MKIQDMCSKNDWHAKKRCMHNITMSSHVGIVFWIADLIDFRKFQAASFGAWVSFDDDF